MKKIFLKVALLLTISTSLLGMVGCGNQKNTDTKKEDSKVEATKLEKIKEAGKIILGTSAGFPPYEFHIVEDGKDKIVGFDIEIAKSIADRIGVEIEIKDMDFKGLLPALKTGNIDVIIAGMSPTENRKKEVDFSNIYYKGVQTILVRNEDLDKYSSLEDLKGIKIAVQKASIQETIVAENIEEANVSSLDKISDLILSLKNKKVDAVLLEYPVAKAYSNNNDDIALSSAKVSKEEAGSAIAIQKGNEDLLKTINEVLDELINEDKINQFVADANKLVEEN